ncbi:1-aminocyclopropane-1-carboxylate synthase 6-like isoform X2 [Curcuma longa]|uniref:1-aminocyclopropane-1-carboxylate synthase 6-like isoform X2 n=1 Tax=Curcuma longa TaxID=136217 RepID=UPI003D9F00E2
MTRHGEPPSEQPSATAEEQALIPGSGGGGAAMRLIVPLQGIVQGHGGGGLVLGSLLPCVLFYAFQMFLKRSRSPPLNPPADGPENRGVVRSSSRRRLPARDAAVSARAALIAKSGDSAYAVGEKRCLEDPYHPFDNPDGVMQLGLAENRLSLDLIDDWLSKNWKDTMLHQRQGGALNIKGLATYQPFDGSLEFKTAIAGLMGQVMQGSVSFDPSCIVLTSGATPAIEILSFCLADTGNAFLVPSPYHPGYDRNIRWRAGIELIPVPCRSTDNFNISVASLERAYTQAKNRSVKVCGILFSNPSNPVGNLLRTETLLDIIDFATEKNIHVIADETFAGSIHGNEEFVSMAEVLNTDGVDRTRVHIVYSLSKVFSIPGFRVGIVYSFNECVLAAASRLSRFSSISAPIQHLLISMLTDVKFIADYLKMNRERLRIMYALLVSSLMELGVQCVKSTGGFYCWMDMSKFMKSYSEKGEFELWKVMLDSAKIHITSGTTCHCIEPGWFRLCFTTLTRNDVPLLMERLKGVIHRQ